MKYAVFAVFIFATTGIQQSSLYSKNSTPRPPLNNGYFDDWPPSGEQNFYPMPPSPNECFSNEPIKLCAYIQNIQFCYSCPVLLLLIISIGKELHAIKSVWPRWKSYVTNFSNIQEWMVDCATITMYTQSFRNCINEKNKKDDQLWFLTLPVIIMVWHQIFSIKR